MQIAVSILACVIPKYITSKHTVSVLSVLCGFLVVLSQPLIEKRYAYEFKTNGWSIEMDEERAISENGSIGWCKEYCPMILTDKNYISQYENSLCYKIRDDLHSSFAGKEPYRHNPVFLVGAGEINVTYAFAPTYEMEISADEDGLIQLPLIYYPGYKIYVTNANTKESLSLDATDTDGLISFEIPKGDYTVKTAYEGTSLRKASFVIAPISLLTVIGFGVYELCRFIKTKKEAKEPDALESKKEAKVLIHK